MSNHVLVLRSFSGLHAGQVLDASDWKHTSSLEEDRYLRRLATDDVLTAVDCPCGLLVLPSANLHICEASERLTAERVAAAKEALAEKAGVEAEPPVTPAPPATPPATSTATQAKATPSTSTPAPTKATAAAAGRSGS